MASVRRVCILIWMCLELSLGNASQHSYSGNSYESEYTCIFNNFSIRNGSGSRKSSSIGCRLAVLQYRSTIKTTGNKANCTRSKCIFYCQPLDLLICKTTGFGRFVHRSYCTNFTVVWIMATTTSSGAIKMIKLLPLLQLQLLLLLNTSSNEKKSINNGNDKI